MKGLKKLFLLACVSLGVIGVVSCNKEPSAPKDKTYTYNDYAAGNPNKWNPHTWESNEDSYIMGFIEMGLYDFIMNDSKDGYDIVPEMAAGEPVDVSAQYAGNQVYGVPSTDDQGNAPVGYAWKIALNPNAKWQTGEAINADTYLYSMEQLLSPKMLNYRADSYYSSNIILANAEDYYNSDAPIFKDIYDSATKTYLDKADSEMYFSLTKGCAFFGGSPASKYYQAGYQEYFQKHGEDGKVLLTEDGKVQEDYYQELVALQNARGYAKLTPEIKLMLDEIAFNFGDLNEEKTAVRAEAYKEFCFYDTGETSEKMSFSSVGIEKTGEYEITLILAQPITEFFLHYSLSSNWIVYKDLYEAGKKEVNGFVTTNYGTSVDTTMAYGPYKLTGFQEDKQIVLQKNDQWYGYTDGKHVGQFQTTGVVCQVIPKQATALLEFLKGNLDTISLVPENMDSYRYSDYISLTPQTYTTKLSFNTSVEKLKSRETDGINKSILANASFRKAFSLAINRQDFAASCTASSSAGFGLLNYNYISDPDTGEVYRDTAQGQKVLKDLYNIDDVSRITGFDKATAATLFEQAYQEELAAGNIKATDKVELEFLTYLLDESYIKIVNAIQKYVNEATVGTALEGKITIKQTADSDYYTKMQAGQCEMILSTWGGNPMNPFAITDCYCNPKEYFEYGYDTKQMLTIEIDTPAGKQPITQSLEDWNKSLNQGTYATATKEVKLTILGAIEYKILSDYATTPLYYRCSASLDSQRVVNGAEKYIPLIGYGGIRFITYTYDDAAWAAYCADQKYKLTY